MKKVRWTDERGRFNSTGAAVDEGIYCGVHYYADAVRDDLRWKLDCWFLPELVPRPEVVMRDRLLAASDEERLAILRLKDAAMRGTRCGRAGEPYPPRGAGSRGPAVGASVAVVGPRGR